MNQLSNTLPGAESTAADSLVDRAAVFKRLLAMASMQQAKLTAIGAERVSTGAVGIPRLLIGSAGVVVPQQIDCSVLTFKPAGFVRPVMLKE